MMAFVKLQVFFDKNNAYQWFNSSIMNCAPM